MKTVNYLICLFFKHKVVKKTEFKRKHCSRCGVEFGIPEMKNIPPPPPKRIHHN